MKKGITHVAIAQKRVITLFYFSNYPPAGFKNQYIGEKGLLIGEKRRFVETACPKGMLLVGQIMPPLSHFTLS